MHINPVNTKHNAISRIEVSCITEIETGYIIPGGHISLLFYYNRGIINQKPTYIFQHILFGGIFTEKLNTRLYPDQLFIIFELLPPFATTLLNEDVSKISNVILPLHMINEKVSKKLSIINYGNDPLVMARSIEKLLLSIIDSTPDSVLKKMHLIQPFYAPEPGNSVDILAYESGVSVRSLERYFKNNVGITPKLYQRILRFNNALHYAKAHPEEKQIDIALKFGFYDQSHMINEFQTFFQYTPMDIPAPA